MPALFAFTLFISALLLFSIQPMVAKTVLPSFGGTPAVWNTCMVFFQAVLLAGYAYAHVLTSRLRFRRQVVVHACLLGLGAVLVLWLISPLRLLNAGGPPDEAHPVWWLLAALAVSVGLPFFAVSATAPLMQRWFADTDHPFARDPYFLYGASNLGSLLALLGYPLLLEPGLRLADQMWGWDWSYLLLAGLILLCGGLTRVSRSRLPAERERETRANNADGEEQLTPLRRCRWLALAFVPSSLLYGVTTFLTTDLASVPLLWVVPLALYLLTFIIAFGRRSAYAHGLVLQLFPLLVLAQTFVFAIQGLRPLWLLPVLHLLTFFVTALACHGELARQRPHARHLTEFYLWLSLGGVLGGLFNTLAAPQLFASLAEYPLALVLACFLVPAAAPSPLPSPPGGEGKGEGAAAKKKALDWPDIWLPLVLFLLAASLIPVFREKVTSLPLRVSLVYGLPAAVCYLFVNRPVRFGLGVGAILLAGTVSAGESQGRVVYRERSFFGVVRVIDMADNDRPGATLRYFVHGSTLHGTQRIEPDGKPSGEPLTYFFRNGPIGEFFASRGDRPAEKIAVLGLGAGTLAAYARGGQEWTFYEIDPAVERVAEDYYSYLNDGRQKGAKCTVRLGDGRLCLKDAPPGQFAVIFADAFSSDAVPVHLLTRQAVETYLDKLAPGGVLVLNITNRCLDLEPVVANIAQDRGLAGRVREERDENISAADKRAGKTPSRWVVLARSEADLGGVTDQAKWRPLRGRADVGVWTDDYSNLVRVLRW
jgi:hypothetical protein